MSTEYDYINGFTFLGFSLVWISFFVWWIVNNYVINKRYLKPLHKLMNFILFCKCIYCICMIGCIFNKSGSEYWDIGVTSMITIYKTFIYTTLVLISKGFCVISDVMRRRDLSIVALVTGSVYLIYSAYFIDPGMVTPILLLMILCLFYFTVKYTSENIKLLKTRQRALIESNIQNLIAPIQAKISLLLCFIRLCCFYFIEQFLLISVNIVVSVSGGVNDPFITSYIYLDEILEFVVVAGIFMILRPKSNMQYFDINLIEPNQPSRPLAPVYKAAVPETLPVGISPSRPVLLIAPKGVDSNDLYRNLLIGNPVIVK